MPLARMCRGHTHACMSRRFRTAPLNCARAERSEPITIGEGLWGPICFLGGSPASTELHLLVDSVLLSYLFSKPVNETLAGSPQGGFTALSVLPISERLPLPVVGGLQLGVKALQ